MNLLPLLIFPFSLHLCQSQSPISLTGQGNKTTFTANPSSLDSNHASLLSFVAMQKLASDNSSFESTEHNFLHTADKDRTTANALYICNQGYNEQCTCALLTLDNVVLGFRCFTYHEPRTCRKLERCSACLKVERNQKCFVHQRDYDMITNPHKVDNIGHCHWNCRCRCSRHKEWSQLPTNEPYFSCDELCNEENNCPNAEDELVDVCRVSLRIPWFAFIPLLLISGLLYMAYNKRHLIRHWCGREDAHPGENCRGSAAEKLYDSKL